MKRGVFCFKCGTEQIKLDPKQEGLKFCRNCAFDLRLLKRKDGQSETREDWIKNCGVCGTKLKKKIPKCTDCSADLSKITLKRTANSSSSKETMSPMTYLLLMGVTPAMIDSATDIAIAATDSSSDSIATEAAEASGGFFKELIKTVFDVF